jgi:hypothetical protein
VRRTHVEAYLRQLEQHRPPLANGTLRRRISTLSSWFTWLEDEDISVGNLAARVRRPRRHTRPQPWLDRNELNGLCISEACAAGGGSGPRHGPGRARSASCCGGWVGAGRPNDPSASAHRCPRQWWEPVDLARRAVED